MRRGAADERGRGGVDCEGGDHDLLRQGRLRVRCPAWRPAKAAIHIVLTRRPVFARGALVRATIVRRLLHRARERRAGGGKPADGDGESHKQGKQDPAHKPIIARAPDQFVNRMHQTAAADADPGAGIGLEGGVGSASRRVNLSSNALTATITELPDIDSAAISGLSVNG